MISTSFHVWISENVSDLVCSKLILAVFFYETHRCQITENLP